MSISRNEARTLSGISAGQGGNIELPSTPDAIRIGGQKGPKGFLVGVDVGSGNVDWVQASTPFIPPNSIFGSDLNENIGFDTTASENGGVIRIQNAGGTATLQADRIVATDFTLQSNFTANQGIFKDKIIMDTTGLGTGNTRNLDLVASTGDIIQYQTFNPPNEYASIKSGVGAFRSITTSGTIASGGNITTTADITAVGSIGATQNIVANTGMQTGTFNATGISTFGAKINGTDLDLSNSFRMLKEIGGVNKVLLQYTQDNQGGTLLFQDANGNDKIELDGELGDISATNLELSKELDCKNITNDGTLLNEGNATFNENVSIVKNLTISGNLIYDGDLQFNDLIFDGFFSQRLDDTDANSELVNSTIFNSDPNGFGGSLFKLKKKAPPQQLNAITDSITFDSRDGSILCTDLTTTNLTATNFTFDNNLIVKILTADDILVKNETDPANPTTIDLKGELGSIVMNNGTEGKLDCKEVETSGEGVFGTNIAVGGVATIDGNLTARNITANQNAPNGIMTCRRLVADEFEFDNNLITRELQSDRITLVDKNDNDNITIVLDGGVNPLIPDVPAGSMAITGEFSGVRQSTSLRPYPNTMGGLKIGVSGDNNANTSLEINGNFIVNDRRAVIKKGCTFTGTTPDESIIMSAPLYNSYDGGFSTFRKLEIASSVGELKFSNNSGKITGYTDGFNNKTECFNLDLSDPSNVVERHSFYRCFQPNSVRFRRLNAPSTEWNVIADNLFIEKEITANIDASTCITLQVSFYAGITAGAKLQFMIYDPQYTCADQPTAFKESRIEFTNNTHGIDRTQQWIMRLQARSVPVGTHRFSVAVWVGGANGHSITFISGGGFMQRNNSCDPFSTPTISNVFPALELKLEIENGAMARAVPENNGVDWELYNP
jgi:hypothetical protein